MHCPPSASSLAGNPRATSDICGDLDGFDIEAMLTAMSSSCVEKTALIFPIHPCVLLDSSASFQIGRVGLGGQR
jgi:hypothetical protein